MNTLDNRYYNAVLNQPDYETAVYNFIKSLNTVEEVQYLWQHHFSPDDSYLNHCFGGACWARIDEIKGVKMEKKNQNRETWCGYRPSVMPAKKKNKKTERKEGKQICREAMKGEKD